MLSIADDAENELFRLRTQRDILSGTSLSREVSELTEQIKKLEKICGDIHDNAEKLRRISEHYEETEQLAADIVSRLPDRRFFNNAVHTSAAGISASSVSVTSAGIFSGKYIAGEEWLDDLIFEWRGEREQV